jgi:hypothetical protein
MQLVSYFSHKEFSLLQFKLATLLAQQIVVPIKSPKFSHYHWYQQWSFPFNMIGGHNKHNTLVQSLHVPRAGVLNLFSSMNTVVVLLFASKQMQKMSTKTSTAYKYVNSLWSIVGAAPTLVRC